MLVPAAATQNSSSTVQLLWPFLALGRKRGYRFDTLARERLGLTEAQLRDPTTRVPQAHLVALLDEAIVRSGERDLGLLAARFADPPGSSDASRTTVRAVLEGGSRFLPLLEELVFPNLEVKGRLALVHYAFSHVLSGHAALCEFALALSVLRLRRLTATPELAPIEVHLPHDKPANVRRHERMFRCHLCFGAPSALLILPGRVLDLRANDPEPEHNLRARLGSPAATAAVDRTSEERLASVGSGQETAARVRAWLDDEDDLAEASTKWVARGLGLSVRTLSRRLRDEGTSYRAVLEEMRQHSAKRQLARGQRSIAEIALALGFASSQGFHRAFKRWTGTTAGNFRQGARSLK